MSYPKNFFLVLFLQQGKIRAKLGWVIMQCIGIFPMFNYKLRY